MVHGKNSKEPRFLRLWLRTLQTGEEYLFLRKSIRLSPVSNSVQYDIPAKDVIAQPVVSRPDAPLSLSRFQARQLLMSCLPDLLYGSSARTLRSLSRTRKSLALRRVMLRASRSKADVVSVR